jgi:hypothetical protein
MVYLGELGKAMKTAHNPSILYQNFHTTKKQILTLVHKAQHSQPQELGIIKLAELPRVVINLRNTAHQISKPALLKTCAPVGKAGERLTAVNMPMLSKKTTNDTTPMQTCTAHGMN